MTYLIGQLGVWLILTAGFAGLAGWAFAAIQARPAEHNARRERDRLMRDLLAIGIETSPGSGVSVELDREMDSLRRRADLDAARVAEMERALQASRARADDAVSRLAEFERVGEQKTADAEELTGLRAAAALAEQQLKRTVDVVVQPAPLEDATLQAWRLRYFEQRALYLENQAREEAPVTNTPAPVESDQSAEWRARTAEARVAHLEEELRQTPPSAAPLMQADEGLPSPFASNAEVDTLLRWRMLYLEKRVVHRQEAGGAVDTPSTALDAEEAEKWKWRARYLEARVRHLESAPTLVQPAPTAIAPLTETIAAPAHDEHDDAVEAAPAPLVPAGAEQRPPALGAPRDGAPDDLTLIEGVSLLQQTTLNSLGIYHFEQIAAWTPANIAWVDQYLRLRGRISEEEWTEQAEELAELGPEAARRLVEGEAI